MASAGGLLPRQTIRVSGVERLVSAARPWREFDRQATETRGYSTAKAKKDYLAQPRIRALEGTEP